MEKLWEVNQQREKYLQGFPLLPPNGAFQQKSLRKTSAEHSSEGTWAENAKIHESVASKWDWSPACGSPLEWQCAGCAASPMWGGQLSSVRQSLCNCLWLAYGWPRKITHSCLASSQTPQKVTWTLNLFPDLCLAHELVLKLNYTLDICAMLSKQERPRSKLDGSHTAGVDTGEAKRVTTEIICSSQWLNH